MAVGLALLAVLVPAVTGCGGGGEETARLPIGANIRNFNATVMSGGAWARLSATLTRPTHLGLAVIRLGGGNPVDIGGTDFGRRSAGPATIPWNLRVNGKRLPPGKYRLVLHGDKGVGRSQPTVITLRR
jgi:hypothetical protein